MITLNEIAKRMSVSTMTVSRALSSKKEQYSQISEARRNKIRQIARDLGYRPSHLARSLSSGKTKYIGYICTEFRHFSSAIMSGILSYIVPQDYNLVTLEWQQVLEHDRLLKSVVDRRIEGVILFHDSGSSTKKCLNELVDYGIPIVLVDRLPQYNKLDGEYGFVGLDDGLASSLAVDHLVDLGHERIVYAARKEDATDQFYGDYRYDGYRKAMKEHGLEPEEKILLDNDSFSDQRPAIKKLLRRGVTAVVGENDVVASMVIGGAISMGSNVPKDLSVIGMGDVADFVKGVYPPLTTVNLAPDMMGAKAAELILRFIENKSKKNNKFKKRVTIPVKLTVRKSTAACKN